MYKLKLLLFSLAVAFNLVACNNDLTPATVSYEHPQLQEGGYLFAFITNSRYYKLHYAISRDGYVWNTLNGGNIIAPSYNGHPDICQGRDGRFYMIGVNPLTLWSSDDCVDWQVDDLDNEIFDKARDLGFYAVSDYGAPKIFYDEESDQYMINWHGCRVEGENDWQSMRTLYVLTKDFKQFTSPELLFDFDGEDAEMSIIDAIIRKVDGRYYAILKDERSREDAPATGKTVRIAKSDNLTGPYTGLSANVTPTDLMREAPIFTVLPDGRYAILAESYNSRPFSYQMFTSASMDGPWVENSFQGPVINDGTSRPGARHGCIVRVPENVYQRLSEAYLESDDPDTGNRVNLEFGMTDNTVYALDGTAGIEIHLADGRKATENIQLTISVPEDAKDRISAYNARYHSDFDMIPAAAISMPSSAVIAEGESSVTVRATVDLEYLERNFAGRPYILPVSVDGGDKAVCRPTGFIAAPVVRKTDGTVFIYTYGSTPTAKVFGADRTVTKAVVAMPGGGYSGLSQGEIDLFSTMFDNSQVAVAVVYYRMPYGNYAVPSTDAYNVLRLMRMHANEWGGYSMTGVMGGSAGAHVATTLSSYVPELVDFQILLYPLVTMNPEHTHQGSYGALFQPATKALEDAFSGELHVSSSTPPAYVAYSLDDDVVDPVYNAQAYVKALEKAGVPCQEMSHTAGGHWVGGWSDFPSSLHTWLDGVN